MRTTTRAVIAAGVTAVLAAAPLAAAAPVTEQGSQPALGCLTAAQSTAEMNDCVGAEYAAAQTRLAAVYRKVLTGKGLAPGDRSLVIHAQQKWIQFRDADCSYAESLNKGGTLAAVDKGICLVRDTVDRANALQDYLTTS
jgi:uncharacterized protein YecT (DUF1311 family)